MIEIIGLNKIYRSKKKNNCKALNDINLVLPDNGLVFVAGKSGSGKSTLLNLIGGLDSVTSGKIFVDGNEISAFSEKKFTDYRNNHIGFIFQDYHLIEEMTVYENVALSLELKTIKDRAAIDSALEKVGLGGYQSRFPSELSGGEQQRVAIARALVKDPKIILADEPTGNLDPKTATAIIEILKELSRECLILIVSHNTNDAFKYADRIIELSGGSIVSDRSRNKDYGDGIAFDGDTLLYPMDKLLTDEDVASINEGISSGAVKRIVRRTDKFLNTENLKGSERKAKISKNNLSFGNVCSLSWKFLKNKLSRIALSSFIVSAIIVCLSLAQTIIFFDSGKIVSGYMQESQVRSVVLKKRIPNDIAALMPYSYSATVGKTDIQSFKDAGYTDNIRPILSYSLPITSATNASGQYRQAFVNNVYIGESLGTMIVDEAFLKSKFGEFEYIALAEDPHPLGVIITDYLADAILELNKLYGGEKYQDLIGEYVFNSATLNRAFINGIINTGYKDRHGELLDEFRDGKFKSLSDVCEDERFLAFTNEVFDSLGFGFSFNENLLTDFAETKEIDVMWHHKLNFNGVLDFLPNSGMYVTRDTKDKYELGEGEVLMNYQKYNEIFGTEYSSSTLENFVPHKITVTQYRYDDVSNEQPLMQVELYIKELVTTAKASGLMTVDDATYELFAQNSIYQSGLYFDDAEEFSSMLDLSDSLNYAQQILAIEGVRTMTKAVDVFIPIFEMVNYVLCVAIIFILVNFAMKMINDKMHDIGILKALGTKNGSLGFVFGLQIALIALLSSVLSTVGYAIFIDMANTVLIASLRKLAASYVVLDLHFLSFKWEIACLNIALIVVLSTVSLVLPMLKVRNIKPVKIIKTRE